MKRIHTTCLPETCVSRTQLQWSYGCYYDTINKQIQYNITLISFFIHTTGRRFKGAITSGLHLPSQGAIVIWEWVEDNVSHVSETVHSITHISETAYSRSSMMSLLIKHR